MIKISGIFAPIVTPFNDDETIAYDKLESNLLKWAEKGLSGVVMPGSNSESAYLTGEERIEIWKVCANVLKGTETCFLAGTGAETTSETVRWSRISGEIGAVATLVLPPYFYKPQMTHDVLIHHFETIADNSPIPILIYNVPVFTGVDFALSTLEILADHPNIIGIKDSSANLVKIALLRASRPDFLIFSGTAGALLPFLSLGAVGGIMALANFAVEPLQTLQTAFLDGQIEEARKTQLALSHINSAVTARFGVSGLKYAMDQTGYFGGPTRKPLLPLNKAGRAEIDRLLKPLALN
jgi:4-hydroxy-2-oxoglutarate aldolase